MTTRTLALAAVSTLALSASASAAAPDPYSGTSVNKEIYLYGDIEPRSDKGKVTFNATAKAVTKFKLKKQFFMCGAATAEIPVSIAKIELNSDRKGKGTYSDPVTGDFKVRIRVRANGKASGSITTDGICRGKVTFAAKPS